MATKNDGHIHKYKRVILSEKTGAKVFKCQVPGCTRFLARELVVGEKSVCWNCEKELILSMENTSLAKPTHIECRGEAKKDARKLNDQPELVLSGEDDMDEFLRTLGI